MSQTLSAIARGSSANESSIKSLEPPEFTPSLSAVAVNALWFSSLGLSVAVSLIAILAKEWCTAFITGRFGSMLKRARMRQQRWEGLERWKMKEIINVLPLLMHGALLLFAVGLSLYLWDINILVALPVVITTILTGLFYIATVALSLIYRFCPYTTTLARFLYPYWLATIERRRTQDLLKAFITLVAWMSHVSTRFKRVFRTRKAMAGNESPTVDLESTQNGQHDPSPFSFRRRFKDAKESVDHWIDHVRGMFLTDRSQLVEQSTPMDNVTSSMISWMISNCEDSSSVDLALQALAGADPQLLPRRQLWECDAIQLVCQRLAATQKALLNRLAGNQQSKQGTPLDAASLYARSLSFLTTTIQGEGLAITHHYRSNLSIVLNRGNKKLSSFPLDVYNCVYYNTGVILDYCWAQPVRWYEIAAFELSRVPVEADQNTWLRLDGDRKQCARQWELLEHIIAGKIIDIPLNVLLALIDGITRSSFYQPLQWPMLLLDLYNMFPQEDKGELGHVIGTSLVVAALAGQGYPTENADPNDPQGPARKAYTILMARKQNAEQYNTNTLLVFGLFDLLIKTAQRPGQDLDFNRFKLLCQPLDNLTPNSRRAYHNIVPTIPPSFGYPHHLSQAFSALLESTTIPNGAPGSDSPRISCLDAILTENICRNFGEHVIIPLTEHFARTESLEMKKACLRGIWRSVKGWGKPQGAAFSKLAGIPFLRRLLDDTISARESITPYIMNALWVIASELVTRVLEATSRSGGNLHPDVPSLLEMLYTGHQVNSTNARFPTNLDDLGLANLWIRNLIDMCRSDPQSVFESGLLPKMIIFYQWNKQANATPRTPDLPGPYTLTWAAILQGLLKECKAAIQAQSAIQPAQPRSDAQKILGAEPQAIQMPVPHPEAMQMPAPLPEEGLNNLD